MTYIYFMFLAFIPAGYNVMLQQLNYLSLSSINSAVNYIDNVRGPLEKYRAENNDATGIVEWDDLYLPGSVQLKKRSDFYFLIDENGVYIVTDKPLAGLADALVKKFTSSSDLTTTGNMTSLLGYYHVGISSHGCLITVARYSETPLISGCQRPLPPEIPDGALVFTDRGRE
ncbi:hypothetical protein VL10_24005 [Leclercia adecarboxylata]|nr:hypothetical protein VL10_24005 [Leclercia adecarboxylata]KMN66744.1 hypothetical protein VK95_04445 [Leclercia sp. LK8]